MNRQTMNSRDIDTIFRELGKLKNPDCVPRRYNPAEVSVFDAVRITDGYVEKRYGKSLVRVRVEQFTGRSCVLSREQALNIADIARTFHGRISTELDWRRVTTGTGERGLNGTCRHSLHAPSKNAIGVDMKLGFIAEDEFELIVEQDADRNYLYVKLVPPFAPSDWPIPTADVTVYTCTIDELPGVVKKVKQEATS